MHYLLQTKLYNNQINARALISQSTVGYCEGKPVKICASSELLYEKAIDHKFLWFIG